MRDYQTGTWVGGDPSCTHSKRTSGKDATITTESRPSNVNHEREGWLGGMCGRCGALREDAQIGLEPTLEAYVATMVEVFREVKRVLRDDGTLWLNLGDSYSGYHGNSRVPDDLAPSNKPGYIENMRSSAVVLNGLPPKNLCMIPARVALALQDDGWILRSEIIWEKPSCMPESVRDRPTRSHEQVYLLTKQPHYVYDAAAIKETSEATSESWSRYAYGRYEGNGQAKRFARTGKPDFLTIQGHHYGEAMGTRNARTVWRINPEPFSGSHFAVFPTELVRRCLLAGSRPGDIVCDPFVGSGTTLLVARELGRDGIGMDLSLPYLRDIARERLGLADLARWEGQSTHAVAPDVSDLPLFQGAR